MFIDLNEAAINMIQSFVHALIELKYSRGAKDTIAEGHSSTDSAVRHHCCQNRAQLKHMTILFDKKYSASKQFPDIGIECT